MTKMCTSDTLMAMLVYDLLSLTSFLTSHPIHFAYLLFFSPYLFSLFSFLSPLLLSTLLALLAVVTITPYHRNTSHLPIEFEFLGKTCGIALNVLCTVPGSSRENTIGVLAQLDEMLLSPIVQALVGDEVLSVEFEEMMGEFCNSTTMFSEVENRDQDKLFIEGGGGEKMSGDENLESTMQSMNSKFYNSSSLVCELEAEDKKILLVESNCEENMGNNVILDTQEEEENNATLENHKSKNLLGDSDISGWECDDYNSCTSDMEVKETESEENDPKNVNLMNSMQVSSGNVGNGDDKLGLESIKVSLICNGIEERLTKSISTNQSEHALPSQGLQREGSLRVERVWKRTLACKLYEERMTAKLREERSVPVPVQVKEGAGEEEEMDMIWEAIEVSSNKSNGHKSSTKNKGKKEFESEEESEYDEGEDYDGPVRQLCCLQAFRVSTRKMNLGVGKPNLVKLSKVLKRMSVFHVGRNSGKRSEEKKSGAVKE